MVSKQVKKECIYYILYQFILKGYNNDEIESSTKQLEEINNSHYENQECFGSPIKFQLPLQFFEKICDLENCLLVEKDLIKIENLARLYKIGVEFYSGVNSVKENDYLFRLQSLFSNKHLSHFYDINADKSKQIRSNIKKTTKYNVEKGLMKMDEYQSAASQLSKFELKFNNALTIVNNDILAQESSMYNMIKKKKTQMNFLAEVVSTIKV